MSEERSLYLTQPAWWYDSLKRDLRELSLATEQERLWFSDEREGKDTSSFIEVCCRIFDDLGLTVMLDEGSLGPATSKDFVTNIVRLDALIDSADEYQTTEKIIASPIMVQVREAAGKALIELELCFK